MSAKRKPPAVVYLLHGHNGPNVVRELFFKRRDAERSAKWYGTTREGWTWSVSRYALNRTWVRERRRK
jgi:hypothetical protein